MATDDDLNIHRSEAPRDEDEWRRIHRAAWRADQTWPISKPIVAVFSNWRAICVVVVAIAWLNKPEIVAALTTLAGVK